MDSAQSIGSAGDVDPTEAMSAPTIAGQGGHLHAVGLFVQKESWRLAGQALGSQHVMDGWPAEVPS